MQSNLLDLQKQIQQSFAELSSEFKSSILFLDNKAQEVLKWCLTTEQLFEDFEVKHIIPLYAEKYVQYCVCKFHRSIVWRLKLREL
jgi:hypothetical protein